MSKFAKTECSILADDVTLYVWSGLTPDLQLAVETHLSKCASCREFVSFMKKFVATSRKDMVNAHTPTGPHPDPSLIVDLEDDGLDLKTSREVSLHLLACGLCREAYLRLRSLSKKQFEERLLAEEIDLGERYDENTLVGPVRVLSELDWKITEDLNLRKRMVGLGQEVTISTTLYESKISGTHFLFMVDFLILAPNGTFDEPLKVSVYSENEGELKTVCDDLGTAVFFRVAPHKFLLGARLRLTLTFRGAEQQLHYRLPAKKPGVESAIRAEIPLNEVDKKIIEMFATGIGLTGIGREVSLSADAVKDGLSRVLAKLDPPGTSDVPWYEFRRLLFDIE